MSLRVTFFRTENWDDTGYNHSAFERKDSNMGKIGAGLALLLLTGLPVWADHHCSVQGTEFTPTPGGSKDITVTVGEAFAFQAYCHSSWWLDAGRGKSDRDYLKLEPAVGGEWMMTGIKPGRVSVVLSSFRVNIIIVARADPCLLYTSPSPRD